MYVVRHSSAICALREIPTESVDMYYVDPPFGTGNRQRLVRRSSGIKTHSGISYEDPADDYVEWLREHVEEIKRTLKHSGTAYIHLDHHWVHYVKVMCDEVFGRECFLNEIVWAYDFGGRGKRRWPRKHDTILVYTKSIDGHVFNWEEIDRIPYMVPALQKDKDRAARGKVPTDVWWMSIVGTASKERNGYPTQKPLALIRRAITASSPPGGLVVDVFAGSGTTGAAAISCGRCFMLVDESPLAIDVMKKRFSGVDVEWR